LIDTPCIKIDYQKLTANINRMQETCTKHNCNLRPHIKTHKSIEIARMQMKAGAIGITCAKVSEAEVMAAGGLTDIFIAYPLIGSAKIDRAIILAKRLNRLILAADSLAGAEALSREAVRHGLELELRLEIDSGAGRTGVTAQNAADLAEAISKLPNIRLTGLFTFRGVAANLEECTLLDQVKRTLSQRGIEIKDLSAGSTPTGLACAASGLLNEIRPGTYVFYDQSCLLQGACQADDIAARIIATVVSTPKPDYAVIDGGSKTFPMDVQLSNKSYAHVLGRDDLILDKLNEEHGMLRTSDGSPTGLKVGDVLELIPSHICPAVNLQNYIYIEEGGVIRRLPVDARGMVL